MVGKIVDVCLAFRDSRTLMATLTSRVPVVTVRIRVYRRTMADVAGNGCRCVRVTMGRVTGSAEADLSTFAVVNIIGMITDGVGYVCTSSGLVAVALGTAIKFRVGSKSVSPGQRSVSFDIGLRLKPRCITVAVDIGALLGTCHVIRRT